MGKEAKEKRFAKIILDVGHKMGAKWDAKWGLSRDLDKREKCAPAWTRGQF